MRQPARRPENSCPDRHPPRPTTRTRAPSPGGQSNAHPPDPIRSSQPRHATIGEKLFGLTKRASRKRPNPCRNPISAGPASSPYDLYGPCSSAPASGCHHRPVPDDPIGSPEQALNLLLLAASPVRDTENYDEIPRVTLSGRSADNLETPRPARAFPDAFNSPIAHPPKRSCLPNDHRPAASRLPSPNRAGPALLRGLLSCRPIPIAPSPAGEMS